MYEKIIKVPICFVKISPCFVSLSSYLLLQSASNSWKYDVWALEAAAPGQPLAILTFHLLKTTGLVAKFGLSESKLTHFLHRIETGYPENPYHNRRAHLLSNQLVGVLMCSFCSMICSPVL